MRIVVNSSCQIYPHYFHREPLAVASVLRPPPLPPPAPREPRAWLIEHRLQWTLRPYKAAPERQAPLGSRTRLEPLGDQSGEVKCREIISTAQFGGPGTAAGAVRRVKVGDTTPPQAQTPGPTVSSRQPSKTPASGTSAWRASRAVQSQAPIRPAPDPRARGALRAEPHNMCGGGEGGLHVGPYVGSQHFCPSPRGPHPLLLTFLGQKHPSQVLPFSPSPSQPYNPHLGGPGPPSHMDTPTVCCPWGLPDRLCGELGSLVSSGVSSRA